MFSRTPVDPSTRAFSYRDYRLFWATSLTSSFAAQIASVSLGWQIYDITRSPLLLGLVGLAQFLPALLLVLVTGLVADRFNRRRHHARWRWPSSACCGIAFLIFSLGHLHAIWPYFVILVVLGTARAFIGPAGSSLAPNLVPTPALANAIALNASAWQLAGIVGPVVGGLLYGIVPAVAFGTAVLLSASGRSRIGMITAPFAAVSNEQTSVQTLLAGFRYIFSQKVVLGAISLDLFAVLMGGAVALLPIFALDILAGRRRSGSGCCAPRRASAPSPWRCGWRAFRSATMPGSSFSSSSPVFGMFTLLFGLSTSVWLSVPLLALIGRVRHGFGVDSRNHHAALDARRGARPGERGQFGVHRRLERARRIPRRHHGGVHRRAWRRWRWAAPPRWPSRRSGA